MGMSLEFTEEIEEALEERKEKVGSSKASIIKTAVAKELGVCNHNES